MEFITSNGRDWSVHIGDVNRRAFEYLARCMGEIMDKCDVRPGVSESEIQSDGCQNRIGNTISHGAHSRRCKTASKTLDGTCSI